MAKDVNLTSQEWCDIVFENKNKKYGAYDIRQSSSKRHLIALLVALALVIFVVFLPTIISTVAEAARRNARMENLGDETKFTNVDETDVEEKMQDNIVEQTAPPPPPLKSSIKFTPPVIASHDEMKEDDGLKSQEQLTDSKLTISTQDIQGTDEKGGALIEELIEHKKIVDDVKEEIFMSVEQMPEFPGGEKELFSFIESNLKYPAIAKQNNIEGRVYVQFVVNSKGNVVDIKVLKSVHQSLSEEAVRVLKAMPKWIPGKQNGHNVSTYFNMPIVFKLR